MKKIIALILIAVMCFSFVSCDNSEEIEALNEKIERLEKNLGSNFEKTIVGTWSFGDSGYNAGITITFNKDHTFIMNTDGETLEGAWALIYDIKTVMLVANGEVEYGCFEEVDGVWMINVFGEYAEKID